MKKLTQEEFLFRFNKIYNNYNTSLVNYTDYNNKVDIICKIHGVFSHTPKKLLCLKNGCPYCNNDIKTIEYYKDKFNEKHNYKFDYSLFKTFKNTKSKIKIICPNHGVIIQTIDSHLKFGCKKCSNKYNDVNIILAKFKLIHNNKYKYNINNYTNNLDIIEIVCKKHGIFYQTVRDHMNGSGCQICKESKGEAKINNYLNENNIIFERQKTFKNCLYKKQLYFDFYLTDLNICIEYDGIQHFKPIDIFGGETEFENIKIRDNIKNKYCEENNIQLIRIKYSDDIEEKLDFYFNI